MDRNDLIARPSSMPPPRLGHVPSADFVPDLARPGHEATELTIGAAFAFATREFGELNAGGQNRTLIVNIASNVLNTSDQEPQLLLSRSSGPVLRKRRDRDRDAKT